MDQETVPFIISPASLHLWFHHLENGAKDEKQTDQKELQQEEKLKTLKRDYKVKNHCCPIPP